MWRTLLKCVCSSILFLSSCMLISSLLRINMYVALCKSLISLYFAFTLTQLDSNGPKCHLYAKTVKYERAFVKPSSL